MSITRTLTATRSDVEPTPRVELAIPPHTIGHYALAVPIGHGGMGTVYRGHPVDAPHTPVAIKVIGNQREILVRALKREFRLMSDFRHPNFVRIYDLYEEDSLWFLVMELVEGDDFVGHVRGDSAARLEPALRQLVQGVAALHASGRLHGDLKPSNVLVERRTDRVVILDFGLAQLTGGEPLAVHGVVGTPSHMAPELLNGGSPTQASDWYAVGTIVMRALTGTNGSGDDTSALADRARALLSGRTDVPAWIAELCPALLDPDPRRRPTGDLLSKPSITAVPRASGQPEAFFGREAELAQCWTAWRACLRQGLARLEIKGEPGAGKTALANRFLHELVASDAGWVLRARCYANERIRFKAVDALVESIGMLCDAQSAEFWQRIDPDDPPLAATLFPSLRGVPRFGGTPAASMATLDVPTRRARAIAAIHRILRALASTRPLVLFIDDLQWGDPDSAEVLAPLFSEDDGSGPATFGLLLMWACRDGAELGAFFAELDRVVPAPARARRNAMRIDVGPLPEPASLQLARSIAPPHVDPARLEAVVHEAHGNPLFIRQATKVAGSGSVASGGLSIERSIDVQMATLGPLERRLVHLFAIASSPVPMKSALRAAGFAAGAEAILTDLRDIGLVTVSPSPRPSGAPEDDRVCLYHERLRSPLVARLDPGACRDLHLSLANALEATADCEPAVLADHFHAGGEPSRASHYAERAAHAAASTLAFHAAIAHYRDAIEWSSDDVRRRSSLRERLGDALFNAGYGAEAAQAYGSAADAMDDGRRVELDLRRVNAWFSAGCLDEALACARPLMDALRLRAPSRGSLLGAVLWRLLRLRFSPSVHRAMNELGRPSPSPRSPAEDDRTNLAWTLGMGSSMFFSQQGMYFALESLATSLRGSEPRHVARGLAFLGGICLNLGPMFAGWGQRCLDIAKATAEAADDPELLGWCEIWIANAALLDGRWEDAVHHADTATELLERRASGTSWERNTARCFAVMALDSRGRVRDVEARAKVIARAATARGDLYGRVLFSLSWAFCRLLADDPASARALADEAVHVWTNDGYTIQHFYALRVLTYCDLYEGRVDRAKARLDEQWAAVRKSDVFVVPSAKLDAILMERHVREAADPGTIGTRDDLRIATLGRTGKAHAGLLGASRALRRGEAARAGELASLSYERFDRLGMDVWTELCTLLRSEVAGTTALANRSTERLRDLGVAAPSRWLEVVVPSFQSTRSQR